MVANQAPFIRVGNFPNDLGDMNGSICHQVVSNDTKDVLLPWSLWHLIVSQSKFLLEKLSHSSVCFRCPFEGTRVYCSRGIIF